MRFHTVSSSTTVIIALLYLLNHMTQVVGMLILQPKPAAEILLVLDTPKTCSYLYYPITVLEEDFQV